MVLIAILRLALVLLVAYVVIFQMIIPVFRGTPLFPMFRKEAKLKEEIEELNQQVVEKQLEEKIESMKQDLAPSKKKKAAKKSNAVK